MEDETGKMQRLAIGLLESYCADHQNYKQAHILTSYIPLCDTTVFHDPEIAEALLSIQDESYIYMDEFEHVPKGTVLLNLFSGSGRLIKELLERGMLSRFHVVYNVDCSAQMIAFEKHHFARENVAFICKDVLTLEANTFVYDLAVCHCGLRYIEPVCYQKLAERLFHLKHNDHARCFVTEIEEHFISAFASVLEQKSIAYDWKKRRAIVQRNTSLYLAHACYKTNPHFCAIINELSQNIQQPVPELLKELAGYKVVNMNLLIF